MNKLKVSREFVRLLQELGEELRLGPNTPRRRPLVSAIFEVWPHQVDQKPQPDLIGPIEQGSVVGAIVTEERYPGREVVWRTWTSRDGVRHTDCRTSSPRPETADRRLSDLAALSDLLLDVGMKRTLEKAEALELCRMLKELVERLSDAHGKTLRQDELDILGVLAQPGPALNLHQIAEGLPYDRPLSEATISKRFRDGLEPLYVERIGKRGGFAITDFGRQERRRALKITEAI